MDLPFDDRVALALAFIAKRWTERDEFLSDSDILDAADLFTVSDHALAERSGDEAMAEREMADYRRLRDRLFDLCAAETPWRVVLVPTLFRDNDDESMTAFDAPPAPPFVETKQWGRITAEELQQLIHQHGSLRAVSRYLGVSSGTVQHWADKLLGPQSPKAAV